MLAKKASLLLIALLASFAHAGLRPSTEVQLRNAVNSGGILFVKYMAPWCEHCKALAPAWQSLYQHFPASVALVDCDDSQKFCDSIGIKGYPTLMLYKDGSMKGTEYDESDMLEDLAQFLRDHLASQPTLQQAPVHEHPTELPAPQATNIMEDVANIWGDENCNAWVKADPTRCDALNYQQNCALTCGHGPGFTTKVRPVQEEPSLNVDVTKQQENQADESPLGKRVNTRQTAVGLNGAAPVLDTDAKGKPRDAGDDMIDVWGGEDCKRWIQEDRSRCEHTNYQENCAKSCYYHYKDMLEVYNVELEQAQGEQHWGHHERGNTEIKDAKRARERQQAEQARLEAMRAQRQEDEWLTRVGQTVTVGFLNPLEGDVTVFSMAGGRMALLAKLQPSQKWDTPAAIGDKFIVRTAESHDFMYLVKDAGQVFIIGQSPEDR